VNFEAIVDEYYTALYRFAYSLAKNEHEAGDLTQQTFVIYARKGDALKDSSKVKSWLFTTLYREFLRIRKRGGRVDYHEAEVLENEAPPIAPDVATSHDSGLAVEALQEVDEIYRAPLTLFFLQDHSYKQIAEILDIPIGTVMSRISRGKSQLKQVFFEKERNIGE
jgi:RNA polymerase sigma-70 factor (ECF subfamily)